MSTTTPESHQRFRDEREAELREPFGWLTLRAFHWLPSEPGRLPGLPGEWSATADEATVTADLPDGLVVVEGGDEQAGMPLDGSTTATVAEAGRIPWLSIAGARIELMRRGGRFCIRVRTATSVERETFAGVDTYPYDPAWVLPARFEPYPEPRPTEVATFRDDLRQQVNAVGELTFTAGGEEQRLVATRMKYGLGIEFHDPTNGTETPLWRQCRFDEPDADGNVTLDLNRTILMWFAFTEYATCPAPVPTNRISVPVRAGERGATSDATPGGDGAA